MCPSTSSLPRHPVFRPFPAFADDTTPTGSPVVANSEEETSCILNNTLNNSSEQPMPQDIETHPVQLVLSAKEIFKFRVVKLFILVSKKWREMHNVDNSDIFQAGLRATTLLQHSYEEARCPRCSPLAENKVVSIVIGSKDTIHKRLRGIVDCFQFDVRSHCTSSRDHIGDSLILRVDNLPGQKLLYSTPFRLLARVHWRKKDEDEHLRIVPENIPPRRPKVVKFCQNKLILEPCSPPVNQGTGQLTPLVFPSIPHSLMFPVQVGRGEPRIIVRFLQHYLPQQQAEALVGPIPVLLQSALGNNFQKVEFCRFKAGICVSVASFKTQEAAVRGMEIFNLYATNQIRNSMDINLIINGLVVLLSVITNWS